MLPEIPAPFRELQQILALRPLAGNRQRQSNCRTDNHRKEIGHPRRISSARSPDRPPSPGTTDRKNSGKRDFSIMLDW
jgi:hypothetical protein